MRDIFRDLYKEVTTTTLTKLTTALGVPVSDLGSPELLMNEGYTRLECFF
jgi:hypothetical protein